MRATARSFSAGSFVMITLLMIMLGALTSELALLLLGPRACAIGDCLSWMMSPLRLYDNILGAIAVSTILLCLSTGRSRLPRQSLSFRGWPVYAFVAAALVNVLFIVLTTPFVGQVYDNMLIGESRLSVATSLLFVLLNGSVLRFSVLALTAAPVALWLGSTQGNSQAATDSRARHILLLSLICLLVPVTLLSALDAYPGGPPLEHYLDLTIAFHDAVGADIRWGFLATGIVYTMPFALVAYLTMIRPFGLIRTGLTSLSLLFTAGAAWITVFIATAINLPRPDASTLLTAAVVLGCALLVVNGLVAWAIVAVTRPQPSNGSRSVARLLGGLSMVLVVFGVYFVVAVVILAESNWAPHQPEAVMLAADPDSGQADVPDGNNCSGIVRANDDLWLVGDNDASFSNQRAWAHHADVQNLSLGVGSERPADDASAPVYESFYPTYTVLSRLNAGSHAFVPVAYLPGKACLVDVPNSPRLLLFTAMERRNRDSADASDTPSVLLASDDNGRHWQPIDPGMFGQLSPDIYALNIDFRSRQSVWATPTQYASAGTTQTGLAYSNDGGQTLTPLDIPRDLVQTAQDIAAARGHARTDFKPDDNGPTRHITQTSDDEAVLWISQRVLYKATPESDDWSTLLRTSSVTLERHGDTWDVGAIQRHDGFYIRDVVQPLHGPAYALLDRETSPDSVIATLANASQGWQLTGSAPNGFWPLPSQSGIKGLWATEDVVVVEAASRIDLPTLTSGDTGSPRILTGGVYYSTDQGRHWHKLDVTDYPGIYGLDPHNSRLYFQNYSPNARPAMTPVQYYELNPGRDPRP